MPPLHDVEPVQKNQRDPIVSSRSWCLDALSLNDLTCGPISYRRPALPGEAGDYLLLRVYQEGHALGLFDESTFQTRPGEIHLFDFSKPCSGITERLRLKALLIPYEAVQYEPRRHPTHMRIGPDTAVGRILRSAIESMFAQLPDTGRAEASTVAAGFSGLLKGLLLTDARAAAGSRDFEVERRLAMRRHLEANLDDPELGVETLCAAFGASRATIYRDFADNGGVGHFIIRRRLERAFRDLASGPPDRGRVRRIAERWGFACPYHFSRAFRKQFDLSPSDVFELGKSLG